MRDRTALFDSFAYVPKEGPVSWFVQLVLLGAAVACLIHLWRRPGRFSGRLLWTLLILVPFLGPLVYLLNITRPSNPTVGAAARNTHADLGGLEYDSFTKDRDHGGGR